MLWSSWTSSPAVFVDAYDWNLEEILSASGFHFAFCTATFVQHKMGSLSSNYVTPSGHFSDVSFQNVCSSDTNVPTWNFNNFRVTYDLLRKSIGVKIVYTEMIKLRTYMHSIFGIRIRDEKTYVTSHFLWQCNAMFTTMGSDQLCESVENWYEVINVNAVRVFWTFASLMAGAVFFYPHFESNTCGDERHTFNLSSHRQRDCTRVFYNCFCFTIAGTG